MLYSLTRKSANIISLASLDVVVYTNVGNERSIRGFSSVRQDRETTIGLTKFQVGSQFDIRIFSRRLTSLRVGIIRHR